MDNGDDETKHDCTGYKNPPDRTKFRKGLSGNPSGRPKGSKNLSTLIHECLSDLIAIRNASGQTEMQTKKEVFVRLMINGALKPDSKFHKFHVEKLLEFIRESEKQEKATAKKNDEPRTVVILPAKVKLPHS